MILKPEIKELMEQSVLCWLATVSEESMPNVSPKEIFTAFGQDQVIIANIASPQTVRNIKTQPQVCLSFVEVLVQKGYQLKGNARIATESDPGYQEMKQTLEDMTLGKFPFGSIIVMEVESVKPILAPSYLFYPETQEADQIQEAKRRYNLEV
ncbi:hypothetical protein SAMN04490243_2562 [Robiginitalea myxolifaciens]|uniref:Pyridoxamine 5'-phosphate oxidase N-terminal domain-containing protein n=1 Tax=Robiginitalea myxolifaciens TaxID=400055 RepID=A0A1I6HCE1_9FLAO|nr:pyridoxamine 5'-phosphate oxidase family protein [Robiginitalea myxolifaciens]SFR52186.1 hypothetical protein SAMN04490243_2562 [Robiginitalea myxolifaciens]